MLSVPGVPLDRLLDAAALPGLLPVAEELVRLASTGHGLETAVTQAPMLLAYIGPGSGLMGVVVFVAALAALVVALIGFLWYPFKRLKARLSSSSAEDDDNPLYER